MELGVVEIYIQENLHHKSKLYQDQWQKEHQNTINGSFE